MQNTISFICLFVQMENLQRGGQKSGPDYLDFDIYLTIAHYYAIRSACMEQHNLVWLCL